MRPSVFLWCIAALVCPVWSEHSILEWSRKKCQWTPIPSGFVCDQHHNFTCFDVPAFVSCLRVSFDLFQPRRDHVPIRVSCRINGVDKEICPLARYPPSSPCNISMEYRPQRAMDHTLDCVATSANNSISCIGYNTASVDFCHEPYVAPKNTPPVPLSSQFYFPIDYEDPMIQKHIKAHPADFDKYVPHNDHPKVGILAHTAHNFHPHFTTRARKEHKGPQTQAFTGGEGERIDYDAIHEDTVIHTPAEQWEKWPTDGAIVDVHTNVEEASTTHTHRLRPWQSSVREPRLPGLQYVTSYNEDVQPVMKLKPDKSGYYKDYTPTDEYNMNHKVREAPHPASYNERAPKDIELENTRAERQQQKLQQLGVEKH